MSATLSQILSRRQWLGLLGVGAAAALPGCGNAHTGPTIAVPSGDAFVTETARPEIHDAEAALQELKAGNQRFADGMMRHPGHNPQRRHQVAASQRPYAVVLACSDSRLPPEMVFDQGLGDLFVIRVAGNIVDTAVLGSIQYALEHLCTPLVMVLGHQNCGAVTATLETVRDKTEAPGDIEALVDAIEPAIALAEQRPGDLLDNTIRANADRSRDAIAGAPELQSALAKRASRVVSAYYSLDSGVVSVT